MQKISFGDTEYIKASDIAKRFRYTQDYVGQLCRAEKVEARLVGRTWYVNPDSVVAYRKTKHTTLKKPTQTKPKKPTTARSARSRATRKVEPVVRSATLKQPLQPSSGRTVAVTYSADDAVAIPLDAPAELKPSAGTKSTAKPKKLRIVKKVRKHTTFTTEKTPEISLSGSLEVEKYNEESAIHSARPTTRPVAQPPVRQSVPVARERSIKSQFDKTVSSELDQQKVVKSTKVTAKSPAARVNPSNSSVWRTLGWYLGVIIVSCVAAATLLTLVGDVWVDSEVSGYQNDLRFALPELRS